MIDPRNVSACLITKDPIYPVPALIHTLSFSFSEVLILTGCDSPHRKQELFAKAKNEYIYYADDDCIAPTWELLNRAEEGIINCVMKPEHLESYANSRIALLGWGSIFPKSVIQVLDAYRAEWGEDALYKRETERIMTWFAYPQNRIALPIIDLPNAYASDRLSFQPEHYSYIQIVEQRCAAIAEKRFTVTR